MERLLRGLILLAIVITVAMLPGFTSSAQQGIVTSANTVSIIVELSDEPAAYQAARAKRSGTPLTDDQLQAQRATIRAAQDQFLSALKSRGVNFQVQSTSIKGPDGNVAGTAELRYTLVYNGITLQVPMASVNTIKSMPQVKKVHSNRSLCVQLDKSVEYTRATKLYGKPPRLTQFDNLNTGGLEGDGVYIAVIDTGIDWPHEMFGGDPTPPRFGLAPNVAAVSTNQKIVYNLPMADAVEDGFGHGTHVASTAAGYKGFAPGQDGLPGTVDDIAVHGVAPQAKLMSYKVCSDSISTVAQVYPDAGGCFESIIILGIEDAVSPRTLSNQPKPVAHVINMSLGGGGGPDDPTAVASDNAARLGCIVVAAAGNSGARGEGSLGSPAAGERVIAVAANTDPGSNAGHSVDVLAQSVVNRNATGAVTPAKNLTGAANQRSQIRTYPMSFSPAPPQDSMAQYYVFVRNGQHIDEWPASVAGRIALVKVRSDARQPTYLYGQITSNAIASGAVGVIFITTATGANPVRSTVPAELISPADGEYLVDLISSTDDNSVDPPNGALSEFPIRLNPFFGTVFVGEGAGFSSMGPVQGLGQVKPDVSAPGVGVLAAAPPASLLGALAQGNYIAIDGTSMATPHVAGAAALVRQAHPAWDPDMVRTAFINTATNMRNEAGAAKADGPEIESIHKQGGGLVDVYAAVHAKALMGIAGDGVVKPSILGSHSYGEVPVVNNRASVPQSVTVTIRDLSGEGGTYNLGVANNRDLQLDGITVTTSPASVTVPANGSATFTVNATLDGNIIRDVMAAKTVGNQVVFERIQMMWYVTATRSDGAQKLRMPFYFRPVPSVPQTSMPETQTLTGTVLAGDNNGLTAEGVTYVDIPFTVSDTTAKIETHMDFFQVVNAVTIDLDIFLLDPDGNEIANSTRAGGPEDMSVFVTRGGTYTYRVTGWQNGPTDFTITSTQLKGSNRPPTLQAVAADFIDAQGRRVDFDGSLTLEWQASGGENGFEIERSTDNQTWEVVASVAGNATSHAITGLANGQYYFRARAIYPGKIGFYVTNPSNTASVLVDQRAKQEITNLVKTAVSNVSLVGGVFQLDLAMTNQSSSAYVPLVELKIVGISSASGTVRVINSDNSGDGTSAAGAALFDYSRQLGSDEQFNSAETSGKRTMRFQDSASELFSFTAVVTGYARTGGEASGSAAPEGGGGESASSGSGTSLQGLTQLLRFTVNPLTKSVIVDLIRIAP